MSIDIYDNYTNKGDQHNRTGTAVIHYSTLPNVLPRQLSHDKSNKSVKQPHNLTPSDGTYILNGYNTNGHMSSCSSVNTKNE